jgi:hypothetical protein
MKRKSLVIALIAFAAVTAAVGGAIASFLPAPIAVWVRVDEANATPLKNVLQSVDATATTTGNGNVIINIKDTRTNTVVSRKGRNASGAELLAPSATTIAVTAVTIP